MILTVVAVAVIAIVAIAIVALLTYDEPEWVRRIDRKLERIMALVTVDQTDLDNLSASLEDVKTSVATELADLETQLANAIAAGTPPPAGSLDGLKAALADLQTLEPPAPAPTPGS